MSPVTDHFIQTRYRTDCYHCRQNADQLIRAVPYQAQVVCDNCGATRVFVPRIEDVSNEGDFVKIGCYDLWNFTVRCRNCGFTHFYKFDLEYFKKEETAGEGKKS